MGWNEMVLCAHVLNAVTTPDIKFRGSYISELKKKSVKITCLGETEGLRAITNPFFLKNNNYCIRYTQHYPSYVVYYNKKASHVLFQTVN